MARTRLRARRTGKGTRVIVPALLRYTGSAIVIDPKGENAAVTARIRAGLLDQAVHVINPWGELATTFKARGLAPATFNPVLVTECWFDSGRPHHMVFLK